MKLKLLACCAALLIAVPAFAVPSPPPATPAPAYALQPGDVLSVSVWKEQELQSEVLLRPDGRISFPLAGDLVAASRSVEELRADLESRLAKFIPEVVVTVAVKAVSGNRIYVLGKVSKPGDFVLGRPTDVMQALSLAGGTTPFAELDGIRVLRREAGKLRAIDFHYTDVERGKHLEQNIVLQGGDTVVVP
ncbi:MAG: polysaccharide biosynthesis/export family protein [Pseudomonadota bacterium]